MRGHRRPGSVRRGAVLVAVVALVANAGAVLPAASARAGAPASGPDIAVSAADALVASRSPALHIGAADTMIRTGVQLGGNGLHYVSYERTYRGLPVVGGDAVVVTNLAGAVLNTAAAQKSVIDVAITPKVGAAAAATAARGELSAAASTSTPRLVVLAWDTPRLAWETVVTTAPPAAPSKRHAFVDAMTGQVADSYDEVRDGVGNGNHNGVVSISTGRSLILYSMADPLRSGIRCGGQNGSTYIGTDDNWGNGSGTNLETACVDALYAVQKEWDMLSQWLGRAGINGSGGGFPIRVGLDAVNAFWYGSYTNFGHSQDGQRQATSIDVVGHEFGHAIFQTTPGGAGSGNENGGLNEGTGDIFGTLTEHFTKNPNDPPDFTVGEKVNFFGNGPIRFMYQPSLSPGDPNCWSTDIPFTEVHSAAGPLNHWFYLLAQGSNPTVGPASPTCDGSFALPGIGIRDAARIFYNALLTKTSTWQYANVRLATLYAASNLYPANCPVFDAVRAAWDAVAVPPQVGEPTCTGAHPVCGETACNPVTRPYISHYTGPGCTGIESYYTPYFFYDGIRRSWDGYGVAGTELRTVTNISYRDSTGCVDAWPEGNTLSDFVTIYR